VAGALKARETIPFWTKGQRRDIIIYNYQVDDEPYEKLPPEAQKHANAGFAAMERHDFATAESCFREALTKAPNSASMQYNLATIEMHWRQIKKARLMLESLYQQHPKYVFATVRLALMALALDQLEEARKLLNQVAELEHFHFEEFAGYCRAQFILSLYSEEERHHTRHWLEMWERLGNDDKRFYSLRSLLERPPLFPRLAVKQMLSEFRE